MLTIKQPAHYGYTSAHDLPTPPSTSRPSPPVTYQDGCSKTRASGIIHPSSSSPLSLPMSAPHRGLPPPAAMTMSHQVPPPGPGGPPQHQHHAQGAPPPPSQSAPPPPPPPAQGSQVQSLGQLPAPPYRQQGEEPMRSWLHAKAEEEKRRQEEEKRKQEEERTRQEELRLDQRKVEQEILRQSLSGGVPPALIPILFAGIGGGGAPVSQAALEWAQQYFVSQHQGQHPQLMPPQGSVSVEHRRDSQPQSYPQYASAVVPSTPGSAPSQSFAYPGSPRSRGHSLSAVRSIGGVSGPNLPSLNTGVLSGQGQPVSATAISGHSHPHAQPQSAPAQQERQGSPICFHHWQPPTTQASSSNQPATPSGVLGESPKKRKASGPQQGPPPSQPRLRSPIGQGATRSVLSNPPSGRRRGHARQRSDISSYRSGPGRGRMDTGAPGGSSPGYASGFSREETSSESSRQHEQQQAQRRVDSQHRREQERSTPPPPPDSQPRRQSTRPGAHSVSSLLSPEDATPQVAPYPPPPPPQHHQHPAAKRSPQRHGNTSPLRERSND